MAPESQRVNFTSAVRTHVAKSAHYICSNPECLRLTGFSTGDGRPRSIAEAAYILPASPSGPRRDDVVKLPDGSRLNRGDAGNAVWLCKHCHTRVDTDPEMHPPATLLDWKRTHEERIRGLVGLDLEQSLLRLGEERRGRDLARQLLAWLDGHRFMYFEDSREFPGDVFLAVQALRSKLWELNAQVTDEGSDLGQALSEVGAAVDRFLDALNSIRIDQIRVKSGDPEFEIFSRSLGTLREQILLAVAPLTDSEQFSFKHIRRVSILPA